MPTEKVNNQSRQVGVRLPHDLDAQIKDYALNNQLSHGQAMIQLMRIGLGETPLDTRETPTQSTLAELTERMKTLGVST
jgi:hypothetical protein